MTMLDTIVRFTHTDSLDGPPPYATHTVHLPVRPDEMDETITRLERLASLFTTITGAYAGGDRWTAWCEPYDDDAAYDAEDVALHVDIRLATGTCYAERFAIARALATVLTGSSHHRITSARDWSVK